MFYLAKYNTQTVISFPMIKRAVQDFAVTGDWTPATGDTKLSKDQGNYANSTNNPAAVGGTGSAGWSITIAAAELQCAELAIQIVDAATKAVEDQFLIVYTYGNASAKIPMDLSDLVRGGLTALPNAAAEAAGGLYTRGTGAGQINQPANGQIDSNSVKVGGQTASAAGTVTFPGTIASATNITAASGVSLAVDQAVNVTKVNGTTQTAGDICARLPAALTANGNMKSSLMEILAAALTETSGYLAAGFKAFFNIASPVLTVASVNQTGDSFNIVKSGGAGDNAAIKTQTDKMAFTGTNKIDASVRDWVGDTIPARTITGNPVVTLNATQGAYAPAKAGDAMLITAGTSAGQLDVTNGVIKANLVQILAATITGTAAQIVAAFTKFFNVAAPTGTVNSIPDAVAGATNGLAIVGSKMDLVDAPSATAVASIKTNLGTVPASGNWNTATPLTAQQTRDAMRLASSATIIEDSLEDKVDDIAETIGAAGAGLTAIPDSATITEIGSDVDEVLTALAAGVALYGDFTSTMKTSIATAVQGSIAEGTITFAQAIMAILAFSGGKWSEAVAGTVVIRDVLDTRNLITVTYDASGRTSVVFNFP